ncbi:MAG: rhodanese-like domain-containing protein [Bacteroidia bacterium]|nr:rhodanese-like domain-containing protein [Bacteroidia bacterium]
MKFNVLSIILGAVCLLASCSGDTKEGADTVPGSIIDSTHAETGEPWTTEQLISPKALAESVQGGNAQMPVIFSIGPSGLIKYAIEIGPAQDEENLLKLKSELTKIPKDTQVVIYCGCCPFADCPNIRPSFKLLNEMGFTNHRLLDIPQNLKVNWIDKGYPMAE